jgi:ABC-type transporter Mla maintaining outer membrane lipid asymmetry ATPase subunit MlaF
VVSCHTLSQKQAIFTWQDVNYTIPYKGGQRQLLQNVEGYVKPGRLTALMGASGSMSNIPYLPSTRKLPVTTPKLIRCASALSKVVFLVRHIPYKGGQRQLLQNVEGYVKPGRLTALMGASGSG